MPEQQPSWYPHGLAIRDYHQGDTDAEIKVHTADGDVTIYPVSIYFRKPGQLSDGDEFAISLCRGRILDVGAGAGNISLVLQQLGHEVTALDIAPHVIEVMRERGVLDTRQGDIYEFSDEQYDTLLLLMNGIGFVGNLDGLDRFFQHAHKLLKPDGQIIFDSSDLFYAEIDEGLQVPGYQYHGEIWYQLEYKQFRGKPYPWLYLDPDTMRMHAQEAGWEAQVLFEGVEGYYVARLQKKEETQ